MPGKRGVIIAVDGPSGVGKTTISRLVAGRLGLRYINTGAMYRALALSADEAGVDLTDEAALKEFCASSTIEMMDGGFIFNGKDYTSALRTQRAGELASVASSKKPVRDFLVAYQREVGSAGGVVMEGRDIGTVVFPGADLKVFLDAPHEVRARRRHLELKEKAAPEGARSVSTEIRERDRRDSERAHSPLKMAGDALYVDTGEIGPEEVADRIVKAVEERLGDIHS